MVQDPPAAHISAVLIHLYRSFLVNLSLLCSTLYRVLTCPPIHQNNPLQSCRRNCLKNVPERSDKLFLQPDHGHLHLYWSVMSLLCCISIDWLQEGHCLLRLSSPLLCSQLICLSTSGPITDECARTHSIFEQICL